MPRLFRGCNMRAHNRSDPVHPCGGQARRATRPGLPWRSLGQRVGRNHRSSVGQGAVWLAFEPLGRGQGKHPTAQRSPAFALRQTPMVEPVAGRQVEPIEEFALQKSRRLLRAPRGLPISGQVTREAPLRGADTSINVAVRRETEMCSRSALRRSTPASTPADAAWSGSIAVPRADHPALPISRSQRVCRDCGVAVPTRKPSSARVRFEAGRVSGSPVALHAGFRQAAGSPGRLSRFREQVWAASGFHARSNLHSNATGSGSR